jgi:SCF-associated factor 1
MGLAYQSSHYNTDRVPIELKKRDGTLHEEVADVSGWLERFALLMRNGEVLVGTSQMLEDYIGLGTPLEFEQIPALQNSGVIKIAFGDWHYHALHKDGTISSYGHEPEGCGALGIGGAVPSLEIRGFTRDKVLRLECLDTGRHVHFEPEKRAWIRDIAMKYANGGPNVSWPGDGTWYEVSEWVEERLRAWSSPENRAMIAPAHSGSQEDSQHDTRQSDTEHDETPAYFAISVTACGWHSAALVLVDDLKAKAVARTYADVQRDSAWTVLPRLQLLDGRIMPGTGPLSRWSSPSGCPKPKAIETVRW